MKRFAAIIALLILAGCNSAPNLSGKWVENKVTKERGIVMESFDSCVRVRDGKGGDKAWMREEILALPLAAVDPRMPGRVESGLAEAIEPQNLEAVWQQGGKASAFAAPGTPAAPVGDMLKSQNLAGLANYATARTNMGLVIGTNVQAFDADLSTWAGITPGTGVGTALTNNIGSAGAPVLFNGAGGTPSSMTGTNITGVPISTGISGLGSGVATAAASTINSGGGFLTASGSWTAANGNANTAATWTTPRTIGGASIDGSGNISYNSLLGVTTAADKVYGFSGAGTPAVFDTTSFGRSLWDDANAAAVRTTITAAPYGVIILYKTDGTQTPYTTLSDAQTAASAGETIAVGPGTYAITSPLGKHLVQWNIMRGAQIDATDCPVWSDSNSAMSFSVYGDGVFTTTGNGFYGIDFRHASSAVTICGQSVTTTGTASACVYATASVVKLRFTNDIISTNYDGIWLDGAGSVDAWCDTINGGDNGTESHGSGTLSVRARRILGVNQAVNGPAGNSGTTDISADIIASSAGSGVICGAGTVNLLRGRITNGGGGNFDVSKILTGTINVYPAVVGSGSGGVLNTNGTITYPQTSGTGLVARVVSPSFTTPALGTPSALVLTNATGLPVAGGGTGLSSGTSGGVPYFNSSSTMASSAALAANALVLGGGAGAAPATTTTGTGVVTALGVNTGSAGAFQVNNASGAGLTSLTAANISAGALADGMTATTQASTDKSTKLATTAYVPVQVLSVSATDTASAATSAQQDLKSYTVPSNTLNANSAHLEVEASFDGEGGGGSAMHFKFFFGGTGSAEMGINVPNNEKVTARAIVIRTSSTAVRCHAHVVVGDNINTWGASSSETFDVTGLSDLGSNTAVLKWTVRDEEGGAGGVVQRSNIVKKWSAP